VVSGGELLRARAAGVAPEKIMFSGVGKTARELALAVDHGILCVNVESEAELELLAAIAAGKGRSADISIRVNPDIDPKTHAKIATGKAENKFGTHRNTGAGSRQRGGSPMPARDVNLAPDRRSAHSRHGGSRQARRGPSGGVAPPRLGRDVAECLLNPVEVFRLLRHGGMSS
jgi:Pyridoxal-dependent decarboxylase, pyridoxal binding domain